jgi:hypothetical protein
MGCCRSVPYALSARFIAHESESGPQIPGLFNAVVTDIGELAVWRLYGLIARLKQSSLVTRYHDVLQSGPVAKRLNKCIDQYLNATKKQAASMKVSYKSEEWNQFLGDYWRRTLCRLLIAIRSYKNGGALLISKTPASLDLKQKYVLPYARLKETLVEYAISQIGYHESQEKIIEQYLPTQADVPFQLQSDSSWYLDEKNDSRAAIAGAIALIASLGRVDGLVLMDEDLDVHAFGVEIIAEKDITKVYIAGGALATSKQLQKRDPQLFGTRHRSMMRYCAAHQGSLGFVISQDGDVRAIMNIDGKVVLWENIQLYLDFDRGD